MLVKSGNHLKAPSTVVRRLHFTLVLDLNMGSSMKTGGLTNIKTFLKLTN